MLWELENVLVKPRVDQDGRKESTVEIEARYIPVDITLEPRESINSEFDSLDTMLQ